MSNKAVVYIDIDDSGNIYDRCNNPLLITPYSTKSVTGVTNFTGGTGSAINFKYDPIERTKGLASRYQAALAYKLQVLGNIPNLTNNAFIFNIWIKNNHTSNGVINCNFLNNFLPVSYIEDYESSEPKFDDTAYSPSIYKITRSKHITSENTISADIDENNNKDTIKFEKRKSTSNVFETVSTYEISSNYKNIDTFNKKENTVSANLVNFQNSYFNISVSTGSWCNFTILRIKNKTKYEISSTNKDILLFFNNTGNEVSTTRLEIDSNLVLNGQNLSLLEVYNGNPGINFLVDDVCLILLDSNPSFTTGSSINNATRSIPNNYLKNIYGLTSSDYQINNDNIGNVSCGNVGTSADTDKITNNRLDIKKIIGINKPIKFYNK